MTRKAKKPATPPVPFSGDRKLRSKLAGIPATINTRILEKLNEKAAETKGECSKNSELYNPNKNEADKAVKNKFEIHDEHAGKRKIGEEDDDTDDLDEFDQEGGELGKQEQHLEADSADDESSDDEKSADETSDEESGPGDSGDEIKHSELRNDPCSNTNPLVTSVNKKVAVKATNEEEEKLAGGNVAGKSRQRLPDVKSMNGELGNDPYNAMKLMEPSLRANSTSKALNDQVNVVAGKNGGKVNSNLRSGDSGDLRTRHQLENVPCSTTKLYQPSTSKNNNGKASKSHLQSHVGNHGAKLAGKPTPATESLPSSADSHQHTEGKKNQSLTTAIGLIVGKNESGKNPDDHKKLNNAVSDLDSEEGAIEEGCDVESSDEDTTILEVFDALGINGNQKEQKIGELGSTALPVLAKTAKPIPEPKKSFAQLFKAGNAEKKGYKLEYIRVEGDIELEEEDVGKTNEAWGHALVGYIAGKNPSYNAVIGYCKSWTHKCRVHFDASGWIVVKFEKEDDLKRVLEGGPYLIYGKPFIVKAMPKYFRYDKSEICKAQVWVNLPHLPLELWTERTLSKIGSKIGEPIQVDSITALMERASFARLLVEVDVSKELINEIDIVLPNKVRITQKVRYEYIPTYCETCQAIGHDTKMCARRRKQAEDQRIRSRATAVSHKPNATSSELASLKVSENPTFDASTSKSSKAQITEKTTEDSEGEFVEYLSKNRKKMLAKGKKQVGFQGSLDIEEIGAGINKAASQWQRKAIVPKETATEKSPNPAGLVEDPIGSEGENVDGKHNPAGLADPVGSEALLAVGTQKMTVCALEAKSRIEETRGAVKSSGTEANVVKGTRVAEQRVVSHTTRSSLTYRDQRKGGNIPRSFR